MEINSFKKDKLGTYIIVNDIKYEIISLRRRLPYIIEFNHKGEYYLIDREYTYIGHDDITKINTDEKYIRIYLYNDGCKPWENKQNLIEYIKKYKIETDKLKDCKNSHIHMPFNLDIVKG